MVVTYDIHDTGVRSTNEDDDANNEAQRVQASVQQVVLGEGVALADEHEPHHGREVEGEAGDEQGGGDGEQVREEGDGLGDDPSDDGDDGDQRDPRDPALGRVDEADDRVPVHAAVNVAADDGAVDGARDEDDGQGDTEGDLGHEGSGRQEGGRLDVLANEGVNERACEGVDDDLDNAKNPDGLAEVLGRVHLVHEGELADGEAVSKDDVRDGDEGINEARIGRRPGGPVGRHADLRSLHTGRDDGHTDSEDDRSEIYVAQDGDLGEGRGKG